MKKILSVLLLVMTIVLASCGQKDTKVTTRIDNPSADTIASLKLDSVKNGKAIKVTEEDDNYYIIKIAEDAKSTLFAHHTLLDEIIEKSINDKRTFEAVNVAPLVFTSQINSYEVNEIMAEIFDAKTGITKESLGVDFDLRTNKKWSAELSCENIVNAYKNSNQRNNYASKIYLPMFVEHYEKNEATLKVFVMVPIYYELTTITDNVNSNAIFENIVVPTLTFDEKTNLLK